ncbi:MAG TPA: arginine--tRNA ligase [Candidatus Limnocylindrales bacterium]|nr:arginine--tRNA ligase [Candidatus Limnocylindrales bacterium]
MSLRTDLTRALAAARDRAAAAGAFNLPADAPLPPIGLERPANPDHGDWASNAAMQLAPVARTAPMRIAEAVVDHLERPPSIADVTIAAPGFLNFRLDPAWVAAQVGPILDAGPTYGRSSATEPRRINVEFVSANPTGPLHVGNARGAFVGDVLSRVLSAAGHDVTREYYFNDFGTQVVNLGLSVLARRTGAALPADGYQGAYVDELAAQLPDELATRATAEPDEAGMLVGRWASEQVRAGIEASLGRLGVRFDVWKEEGSLHTEGWVERAVDRLRDAGYVYERDGATWFRSTAYGDDKDRVIYRSNGQSTYFASDIGYVTEKFARGFDELIYIWGADHHGTVARVRNAAEAMGYDREAVRMLLIAWVRFVRDGVEIPMSKRSGEFITLDEVLDEVGVDAARWFFSSRSFTSGIDFDLELAKKQSNENPVYYVQYAHARASSILRHAEEVSARPDAARTSELLTHPSEQTLIRHLLDLPDTVAMAAERRETHEVPRYAYELANAFSMFYRDCKVLTEDPELTSARLALVGATRAVLANALDLLGISAPESM